jgi:hypothetical protein
LLYSNVTIDSGVTQSIILHEIPPGANGLKKMHTASDFNFKPKAGKTGKERWNISLSRFLNYFSDTGLNCRTATPMGPYPCIVEMYQAG